MTDDYGPMCDVKGCIAPMFCWVDGNAHCYDHFEMMWDRWEAVGINPAVLQGIEPIAYRSRIRRYIDPLPVDYPELSTPAGEGRAGRPSDDDVPSLGSRELNHAADSEEVDRLAGQLRLLAPEV